LNEDSYESYILDNYMMIRLIIKHWYRIESTASKLRQKHYIVQK